MSNVPISKKQFVDIINDAMKKEDFLTELHSLYRKYGFEPYTLPYGDAINLLQEVAFPGTEDIDYFCYELDFGRSYVDGCVTDSDGNPIDLSTAEKLYDYLVSIS